jgi:hypothetical protein
MNYSSFYRPEKNEVLGSRAYTPEQVKVIAEHQNERNALATQLSYSHSVTTFGFRQYLHLLSALKVI